MTPRRLQYTGELTRPSWRIDRTPRMERVLGKFNSSVTRVAPVFGRLFASDASGATWLPTLLHVGPGFRAASASRVDAKLVDGHRPTWGEDELALPAPLALLEHLVLTITPGQVAASGDQGEVLAIRRKLAARDAETIGVAIDQLRAGARGRQWCVLEGASRPDATLEMRDAVLVVEGKRTERTCTSTTKWMGARSQLIRHMDAAMESYPGKTILGLLIVEGDGGADAVEPSVHWMGEASAQIAPELLRASLPHRSPAERDRIASGVLGVTTWQRLCAVHRLPWPPAPDGP